MLRRDEVDVIVMETPTMSYFMRHDAWASTQSLQLSPPLGSVPIAAMTPEDSEHLEGLNLRLLQFTATEQFLLLFGQWFSPPHLADASGALDAALLGPAFAILGSYFLLFLFRKRRDHMRRLGKVGSTLKRTGRYSFWVTAAEKVRA